MCASVTQVTHKSVDLGEGEVPDQECCLDQGQNYMLHVNTHTSSTVQATFHSGNSDFLFFFSPYMFPISAAERPPTLWSSISRMHGAPQGRGSFIVQMGVCAMSGMVYNPVNPQLPCMMTSGEKQVLIRTGEEAAVYGEM